MSRAKSLSSLCILLVLLGLAGSAPAANAQTITGQISGTIKDTLGAVVADASVTLINTDTNETVRTVTTDSKGNYTVPLLQIGTYTVTASKDGFNISKAEGIQLHISDAINVDLTLSVREANETVTVTSEKGLAPELESAAQTSVVTGTEMKELALNTRNFEQMIQLEPGVNFGGDTDQNYTGQVTPSGGTNNANLSVDGQRATQNAYLLDGTDMLSHGQNNQVALFPSIDSIQELRVVRDSYGAQYGGGGAAQIQIITKSGGSEFHGDLYVFARNAIFNANTFFGNRAIPQQPRPVDNAYDGGASIGGPVYIPNHFTRLKDNTFFFYSIQVTRDQVGNVDDVANAPTQAQLAGNFAGNTVCTLYVAGTCSTTGSQINPLNFDPEAQAYIKDILQYVPPPNGITSQTLTLNQIGTHNEFQHLVRIDHTFNQRLSMFFRFIHDPIFIGSPYGYNRGNGYPGVSNSNISTYADGYMLHATYALTPATVLDAAFSFQPYSIDVQPVGLILSANSPDIRPTLPFVSTLGRVPSISINNGSPLNAAGPSEDANRTYQAFANVFHVFGQHSVSTGVNFEHLFENVNQGTLNAGIFSFTSGSMAVAAGTTTFDIALANFLLGHVATYQQSTIDPVAHSRANLLEAYIQDDWKILPRLTLNLGVRYTFAQQPTDADGNLGSFDPRFYDPSTAPTIQGGTTNNVSGTDCLTAPCLGGVLPNPNYNPNVWDGVIVGGGNSPYGGTTTRQPYLTFAPRVGFALDVYGDGKTSLRGGYGIFYNQVPLAVIQTAVYENPYYVRSYNYQNVSSFSDPAASTAAGSPPNVAGVSSNWKVPYTEAYSLGVQQQIMAGFLLDVRYVGNQNRHLIGQLDINQPLAGAYVTAGIIPNNSVTTTNTPFLNQIRPYKGYTIINSEVPDFTANYNALQVELDRKFAKRSRIGVAYTWSRALSDSLADQGQVPQNTYQPKAEYGLEDLDRRHVLTAHFVYELPYYEDQRGWKGHILGGWETSGIITCAAGLPLTAVTNTASDPAGQGVLAAGALEQIRPNQTGDPNGDAPHGGSHLNNPLVWFNEVEHFTTVPAGSLSPGNERNGAIRGPGYQVWNLDLFKNIAINEKSHLQLRVEAFNVWNHTNFTTVQLQLNTATAGDVTAARDPRKMQFGVKYIF